MRNLSVHFLPKLIEAEELHDTTCVVIDVLRATTTIVQALAAGANEVLPCLEIADAERFAAGLPPGTFALGGERRGEKIAGFDFGNSPAEYTAEAVGKKTVIFTTTNGTRALLQCDRAKEVLIGAFTNGTSVARRLEKSERIHLICAGTDGIVTGEDVLLAGWLVTQLRKFTTWTMNDSAKIAESWWHRSDKVLWPHPKPNSPPQYFAPALERQRGDIKRVLERSHGGQNLMAIDMAADIEMSSQLDLFNLVPHFANGKITPLVYAS